MTDGSGNAELPTGVITFLFTDVVGSTRLWEREPDAMADALHRLDDIMATCVADHAGVLIKIRGEGDSTFSVFQFASDAIGAAVEAQRRVAAEPWSTSSPITMRVAIHSGEAEERSGDFYGRTVNRAARLRSLAGPGDVFVSQTTADLAEAHITAEISLVPIGWHQLRDIDRPEHVHVVRWPGAPVRHPPAETPSNEHGWMELPGSVEQAASARFVGRTKHLDELRRVHERAAAGSRQIVIVGGEAGLGKTSLCCRAAAGAHESGFAVLFGRCERDLPMPYRPFAEAVGRVVDAMSDTELALIDDWAMTGLSAAVPQLRGRMARYRSLGDLDDSDRYVVMEALVHLLSHLATAAPIVLVLEDLHWADADTIRTIRHLARSDGPANLSLVINYRSNELDPEEPINELLADLTRHPNLTVIELVGLDVDELGQLVQGRVPMSFHEPASGARVDDAAQELAAAVHAASDGNPFFAGEIIRHLEDDLTGGHGGDPSLLPETLGAVIRQRVRRHGDVARTLLGIAAACGTTFDAAIVAELANESDDHTLDLLEGLQRGALVRETGHPGQFRFTHGLVQQALYRELSATRRARLHHRIAETLESIHADEPHRAEEIARHWERSGLRVDDARVVRAIGRAAGAALAQHAPERALDLYTQLVESIGPADPKGRAGALIGLGESQRQLGRPDYIDTLVAAADHAAEAGDGSRLVAAVFAMNRGMVASAGVVDDRKMNAIERALSLLGPSDSPERARLLAMQGAELLYGGDYELRRSLSDEAVAIARRTGDPSTLVEVLNERFLTITSPATARERQREGDEAEAIAAAVGDLRAGFFAALGGSLAALECGDGAAYTRRLDRMAAIADELQRPVLRWIHLWNDAVRLLNEGQLELAQEIADRSVELGMELNQPDAVTNYSGILGSILLHRGQFDLIVDEIGENAKRFPSIASYRVAHAVALADRGDADRALKTLDDHVRTDFVALDDDLFAGISLALLADLTVRFRHTTAARALIARMRPFRGLVVAAPTSCQGAYSHWLAGLHAVMGDDTAAMQLYDEADTTNRSLDFPYFIAQTSLARGQLLGDQSMVDEASRIAIERGYARLLASAEGRTP